MTYTTYLVQTRRPADLGGPVQGSSRQADRRMFEAKHPLRWHQPETEIPRVLRLEMTPEARHHSISFNLEGSTSQQCNTIAVW